VLSPIIVVGMHPKVRCDLAGLFLLTVGIWGLGYPMLGEAPMGDPLFPSGSESLAASAPIAPALGPFLCDPKMKEAAN
jgi:hypothetical protein